jgi:hypothetical protein
MMEMTLRQEHHNKTTFRAGNGKSENGIGMRRYRQMSGSTQYNGTEELYQLRKTAIRGLAKLNHCY